MKALIIENEYDVDNSVKAFLKDNPKVFESVNEQTFCLNRKVEDLFQYIMKVDTIIIATTFMYKDQVIEYIKSFLKLPPSVKFNFFVHSCVHKFNDWKTEKYQTETIELRSLIIKLMEAGHTVYDYSESWEHKRRIKDKYCEHNLPRTKTVYCQLHHDKECDLFYLKDRKHHDLKSIKDDNEKQTS